jgi:flagellar biosynthesis/type III secretory pathway chaperone
MENGMETLLKSLNDCIDRQLNLYRKLLDLFLVERHAILSSKLEELNAVVMDKEGLLQKIRNEELKRRQVCDDIAERLGMASGPLTITRLSEQIDAPCAAETIHRGKQLQSLIDEIQVESERNRSLCLQALQFVNGSIKLLTTLSHPNQVYHASGRFQSEGRIGRMLSGAV